jgi:hypothetical protein
MFSIDFWFGVRAVQDLPGYSSGRYGSFIFKVASEKLPKTWEEAFEIFKTEKDRLLRELKEEGISCLWQPIKDRIEWIPTCYLEKPEYIDVEEHYCFLMRYSH